MTKAGEKEKEVEKTEAQAIKNEQRKEKKERADDCDPKVLARALIVKLNRMPCIGPKVERNQSETIDHSTISKYQWI